ncbi:hypothetical protein [Anaeromyxobacter sp. SG64]|uniref:hypothetical protein n=1 Tax=Anaeromyxobacter sp. SG64 TaxID=2925409 RepID=UPI001F576D3E|nr:hypothetical protein [Anaeromyxobacter sp. SG64]
MARPRNSVETQPVTIRTTPWVVEALDVLATTGRFGKNAAEVAEELLRAKLRDVEREGWMEKAPRRRRRS